MLFTKTVAPDTLAVLKKLMSKEYLQQFIHGSFPANWA